MKANELKITDVRTAVIDGLPKTMILLKMYTNSDIVGYGEVPDAPGLGIESLNEELIKKFLKAGEKGAWEDTSEWNGEWSNDREWL
ncbi:MAG: hypothetical protein IJS67_04410 [Clostridia bacterium]|nr:hypothetical protein [Clostridia bacterium]